MSRARPNQALLRSQVWERDRGVCACCKVDTRKLIDKLARKQVRPTWLTPGLEGKNHRLNAIKYILELWGAPRTRRSLWDADHIHELADGGADELSNLQTLCIICHRDKGTARAPLRAKSKRTRKKFQKHSEVMAAKFPFERNR